eukprot:CAMPEP_0174959118 /NCGR_PEP_ID=MMETSP0004_2-20121128/3004_1 /TAXON_ID=420556 /ORGANISM="Ochromonas sp., Strain CCMP1393" /LENGTH=1262 /DNA_ID=CAMNT_0016207411 /DNA_START=127 /DNA_END=3915 /DNA_ORIENTATION=-
MPKRSDWLNLILLVNEAERSKVVSPAEDMSHDDLLKVVKHLDTNEYSHIASDTLKQILLKCQSLSFSSTLSSTELTSAVGGILSEDEQNLLATFNKEMNDQSLAPSTVKLQAVKAVAASLGISAGNADCEAVAQLLPFLKRTEVLLSIGGDDRLTINFKKDKLNKYFSSTLPRPGMIRRGSCTCSTMTLSNYQEADGIRREFIRASLESGSSPTSAFSAMQDKLLRRVYNVLGFTLPNALEDITASPQVVLFPSGSDAEYLPLLVGLVRSYNLAASNAAQVKVFNYVTAAGEVGSGTAAAAGGRHFSALAPRGETQVNNELLAGMQESWVEVVQFKPRAGADGAIKLQEQEIAERVRKDLTSDPAAVAVIHAVCGSKTGLAYPSMDVLLSLREEFGSQRVVLVVDACQLRCELKHIARYTQELDCITLVTGSKFFTGPPFSGAVTLPSSMAGEIEQHFTGGNIVVPPGLRAYLTPQDIPPSMAQLKTFLGEGDLPWLNFGAHLRWSLGVTVMEKYNALPPALVKEFTLRWITRVRQLVAQQAPYLTLLPDSADSVLTGTAEAASAMPMQSDMVGGVTGIIPIVISVLDVEGTATAASSGGDSTLKMRQLHVDEGKVYHREVTQLHHPSNAGTTTTAVAASTGPIRCMLGQPVKLASDGFAVLRIALGADMVVDALEGLVGEQTGGGGDKDKDVLLNAAVERLLREDDAVVTKMGQLARNWHTLRSPGAENSMMKRLDRHLMVTPSVPFESPSSGEAQSPVNKASQVLRQLYPGRCAMPEVVAMYDMDTFQENIVSLKQSFSKFAPESQTLHCYAIKSSPLTYLCHRAVASGLGLETASLLELKQAIRSGCDPSKVVFDSPCKSEADLRYALRMGVMVNANSYAEVEKIDKVLQELRSQEGVASTSKIGLRINPLVGAGKIQALSTATVTSKFGVPCPGIAAADGPNPHLDRIIDTYVKYPWLQAVMCHVGSQGMALESMVAGAETILNIADLIDAKCGERRITHVDIGGGLSANYESSDVSPTFQQYADRLAHVWQAGGNTDKGRVLLTEFGKSLVAKTAVIATKVEDCVDVPSDLAGVENKMTMMVQAGADVLLRTAYAPQSFSHRIALLDADKQPLQLASETAGVSSSTTNLGNPATALWQVGTGATQTRPSAQVTVGGPLCFSGDILARDLDLPRPVAGDICLILDAGANTLSLQSKHCSRLAPAAFAFRRIYPQPAYSRPDEPTAPASSQAPAEYVVACIREQEEEEDMLNFWGPSRL